MVRPNIWLLLTSVVLLSASGCAAFKATQQPGKKNLSVLTQGTPRTHLIAELGPPMWSEERRGVTTDVFVFKQGYTKGAKASRAFVHGAADVVTGGLWEVIGIPAETLADGTDVKVQVVYDSARNVKDIEIIEGKDAIEPRRLFGRTARKTPPIIVTEPVSEPAEMNVAGENEDASSGKAAPLLEP
jgi:hypothetical protein